MPLSSFTLRLVELITEPVAVALPEAALFSESPSSPMTPRLVLLRAPRVAALAVPPTAPAVEFPTAPTVLPAPPRVEVAAPVAPPRAPPTG